MITTSPITTRKYFKPHYKTFPRLKLTNHPGTRGEIFFHSLQLCLLSWASIFVQMRSNLSCAGLIYWSERALAEHSHRYSNSCTQWRQPKVTHLPLKTSAQTFKMCHVWYRSHLFSRHISLNKQVRDIGHSGCSCHTKGRSHSFLPVQLP